MNAACKGRERRYVRRWARAASNDVLPRATPANRDMYGAGLSRAPRGRYALAMSYLNEELLMQLEGRHLEQARRVQAPILLNLAACHLRLGDHGAAEWNCSQARGGRLARALLCASVFSNP